MLKLFSKLEKKRCFNRSWELKSSSFKKLTFFYLENIQTQIFPTIQIFLKNIFGMILFSLFQNDIKQFCQKKLSLLQIQKRKMEKQKKNQRKSRIVTKKVLSNLLKNWSMGKLQKLQMNNKSTENYSHDGHSESESLLNYLAYLKEAIGTTTEQIRKENIKAKQTFFNISAHFGINEWTRDKIQENMDSVGVISLAEPSSIMKRRRSQKKNERGKNRKVRGDEETGKLGEPKKRVKMMGNAGVEEVVKPK